MLTIALAVLAGLFAAATLLLHLARKRDAEAARTLRDSLRADVAVKDAQWVKTVAERNRITRMHIGLGQEYCQIAEQLATLEERYDETYDAWFTLDQGRAQLEEFARQAAVQATQATVVIHEADVVEPDVPLLAWNEATTVHEMPVLDEDGLDFPSVEGETGSWRIPRGQMALAGGAA